jgi:hypothetical protein
MIRVLSHFTQNLAEGIPPLFRGFSKKDLGGISHHRPEASPPKGPDIGRTPPVELSPEFFGLEGDDGNLTVGLFPIITISSKYN